MHPEAWKATVRQLADFDMTGCTWTRSIGTAKTPFTGTYLGNGRSIANLVIEIASGPAGVFGVAKDATLQSVTVTNVSVTGTDRVGGLVGMMRGASAVKASSSSGHVSGRTSVGGLVGLARAGIVVNDYSTAAVEASEGPAGGLAGELQDAAIVRSSYFMGSVGSAGQGGPIIGAGSASAVRDSFWVDPPTAVAVQPGGLQRTMNQMRDVDTFASAGWQIVDGWTPAVPWAICSGVKRGFPFHSKDFDQNPCATLTPSTPTVRAQAGIAITPVTMQASKFTPTTFSVTSGILPSGLTLDSSSGRISGKPTKKAPARDIVITGSDGSREARTLLSIGVTRSKPSAADPYSGCEPLTVGMTLTVTCQKPGEAAIDAPRGAVLVGVEALGADAPGLVGRIGAGASVTLTSQVPAAQAEDGAYVVTVGSAGTRGTGVVDLFTGTGTGGTYSSVESANPAFGGRRLIAAAGGAGAGGESLLSATVTCLQWLHRAVRDLALQGGTRQQITVLAQQSQLCPYVLWTWPANAGTTPDTLPPASGWADHASGGSGPVGIFALFIWSPGPAGKTYAPDGAVVNPRPTTSASGPRHGRVVLTFDLTGVGAVDVNNRRCSSSAPALGELVTCSEPGLAVVSVPADAEVAVVTASGAGGGAGYAGARIQDFAGGSGGKVSGVVNVSELDSLVAQVGALGPSVTVPRAGVSGIAYGQGGGYSAIGPTSEDPILLAGGGGGGGSLSADDLATAAGQNLAQTMAGATVTKPGSTLWPVPASASGSGANGGLQGQSWFMADAVSRAEYEPTQGGTGGAGVSASQGARNGLVTLRFCALPGAPTVASVTAGTAPGQATADVVAKAPSNTGGCDLTKYQFRTSTAMEWADVQTLDFPIVFDLTSGQSLCVQMRVRNAAGWGPASAYTCGTASDAAATAVGADGIVIEPDFTVSPTSLSAVGNGNTFAVHNDSASLAILYADSADMTVGGSSCRNGCEIARNTSAVVTLVSGGDARVYVETTHALTGIVVH